MQEKYPKFTYDQQKSFDRRVTFCSHLFFCFFLTCSFNLQNLLNRLLPQGFVSFLVGGLYDVENPGRINLRSLLGKQLPRKATTISVKFVATDHRTSYKFYGKTHIFVSWKFVEFDFFVDICSQVGYPWILVFMNPQNNPLGSGIHAHERVNKSHKLFYS